MASFTRLTRLFRLSFLVFIINSQSTKVFANLPDRNSKMFPYFLVQFRNEPCSNQNGTHHGTCISSKECRDGDGQSLGVCAKGFGVCCKRLLTCSSEGGDLHVRENSTELRAGNASASCRYILPKNRGVCQVRLDFVQFRFGNPNPNGDCGANKISISGGTTKHENLCGDLTGQHLYLNYGDANKIYIYSGESSKTSDAYSILVTFIQCGSRQTVPSYCDQYYMQSHGRVMSFNWPKQQLNSQYYTVCVAESRSTLNIQRHDKKQTISWSKCNLKSIQDFFISGNFNSTVDYLPPENCEEADYIQIFGGSKQCGRFFMNETVSFKPYLLRVNFDGIDGLNENISNGIVLAKPEAGCASLQTAETHCMDESFGRCRCWKYTKRRINSKQKERELQDDVSNTGFCLSYEIK